MKENPYDGSVFFEKYRRFPRSVQGLSAAGEWHELERLLPDFTGKRVLDIGCGFGWHCEYAARHGAKAVLGIDLSENMLAVAREKTLSPIVTYRRMAMEDMDFPPGSFDVALSSLAFHYTPDFAGLCGQVYRLLAPGGAFVFSVEHPVFTAQGTQDWMYDPQGAPLCWPVDRYFDQGPRQAVFLGQTITKYHQTLTTYLRSLLKAGFSLRDFVEPQPSPEMLDSDPGMREELRRPMMMILAAEKG